MNKEQRKKHRSRGLTILCGRMFKDAGGGGNFWCTLKTNHSDRCEHHGPPDGPAGLTLMAYEKRKTNNPNAKRIYVIEVKVGEADWRIVGVAAYEKRQEAEARKRDIFESPPVHHRLKYRIGTYERVQARKDEKANVHGTTLHEPVAKARKGPSRTVRVSRSKRRG